MLIPMMLGPLMLFFIVPVAYSFFVNDLRYRNVVSDPDGRTRLSDDFRNAAATLNINEKFGCVPSSEGRPKEPIYTVLHGNAVSLFRRFGYGPKYSKLYDSAYEWKVPVLRRGFDIRHYAYHWGPEYDELTLRMDSVCKAQREHAENDEPFDPPIAINGEFRDILLRAADGTDAAVARYRAVRVPLVILVGLLSIYGLASVISRCSHRPPQSSGRSSSQPNFAYRRLSVECGFNIVRHAG
jgi:hypothetical protein